MNEVRLLFCRFILDIFLNWLIGIKFIVLNLDKVNIVIILIGNYISELIMYNFEDIKKKILFDKCYEKELSM